MLIVYVATNKVLLSKYLLESCVVSSLSILVANVVNSVCYNSLPAIICSTKVSGR